MEREEFIREISALPGVGEESARKLYDSGYDTLEKVQRATVEELVQAGIRRRVAEAIVEGLKSKGAAPPIEVVEKPKEAEEKPEVKIVEEEAHVAHPKPELTPEVRRALFLRKIRARKEPEFLRYHHWYMKGISSSWRRPKGATNKQRRGFAYRPKRVKVGFGKPSLSRGLHPSGFAEVLVHNAAELERIDPKRQAARIASGVGLRKRKLILEKAVALGIHVLNPGVKK